MFVVQFAFLISYTIHLITIHVHINNLTVPYTYIYYNITFFC